MFSIIKKTFGLFFAAEGLMAILAVFGAWFLFKCAVETFGYEPTLNFPVAIHAIDTPSHLARR